MAADILILRLRGPLMAFGDVAVDEIRPTDILPGLSFLTGLLGNALGWLYTDGHRLQALQNRLRMASRLDKRGEVLRDYQNAHIHKGDKIWRYSGGAGGRDCGASGESIVQRWRYYRADSAVTVALTLDGEEAPTMDDLEKALRHPARPLFLGRVNCPPSGPVYRGERLRESSLEQALRQIPYMDGADAGPWLAEFPCNSCDMTHLHQRQDVRLWENDVHGGSRIVQRIHLHSEAIAGKGGAA